MGQRDAQERKEALDKILDELAPQIPAEQYDALRPFVYQYYSMDTRQDLMGLKRRDLLGSTLSFWKFLQYHDPARPEIEVLNPDYPHHGWHSTHSIIRMIHRDMPFLVDSLRMKLNENGVVIHHLRNTVMSARRNEHFEMVFDDRADSEIYNEAIIYVEIDRQEKDEELEQLKEQLMAIMTDVSRVVEDYHPTCDRIKQLATMVTGEHAGEVREFLEWLLDDKFTFLGYEELKVIEQSGKKQIIRPSESLLGLLKTSHQGGLGQLNLEPFIEHDFFQQSEPVSFSKASVRSTVHRPAYPDFITVRLFAEDGSVAGEARIVGLYTSPVYRQSPFPHPLYCP